MMLTSCSGAAFFFGGCEDDCLEDPVFCLTMMFCPVSKWPFCSGWMQVARKWLIPDTYRFFPIKTRYVKSLSNVTIPYKTGVVHEKCGQECELGEIQNKLYPYPGVSQSGWRWLSNGDVSLRWGGCISSPCCSDWTLASLAWKSGASGHPPAFKRVFVFFSVERFVFCRKLPYQKQPSPSIITIKGDVFYYQMGQYLEGTRCDLRLIVWEPR